MSKSFVPLALTLILVSSCMPGLPGQPGTGKSGALSAVWRDAKPVTMVGATPISSLGTFSVADGTNIAVWGTKNASAKSLNVYQYLVSQPSKGVRARVWLDTKGNLIKIKNELTKDYAIVTWTGSGTAIVKTYDKGDKLVGTSQAIQVPSNFSAKFTAMQSSDSGSNNQDATDGKSFCDAITKDVGKSAGQAGFFATVAGAFSGGGLGSAAAAAVGYANSAALNYANRQICNDKNLNTQGFQTQQAACTAQSGDDLSFLQGVTNSGSPSSGDDPDGGWSDQGAVASGSVTVDLTPFVNPNAQPQGPGGSSPSGGSGQQPSNLSPTGANPSGTSSPVPDALSDIKDKILTTYQATFSNPGCTEVANVSFVSQIAFYLDNGLYKLKVYTKGESGSGAGSKIDTLVDLVISGRTPLQVIEPSDGKSCMVGSYVVPLMVGSTPTQSGSYGIIKQRDMLTNKELQGYDRTTIVFGNRADADRFVADFAKYQTNNLNSGKLP